MTGTLTDVLTAALERPDAVCGPPVDMLAVLFRPSDVPEQLQREPGRGGVVPVILGMSPVQGSQERPYQGSEKISKRSWAKGLRRGLPGR